MLPMLYKAWFKKGRGVGTKDPVDTIPWNINPDCVGLDGPVA